MNLFKYCLTAWSLITKFQNNLVRPIHIQVDPSSYCNLKCKMCMRQELSDNEKDINMSLSDFKKIQRIISPRFITFGGLGEPTMNPIFTEIVRFAKSKDIKTVCVTNCTLIRDSLAEEIIDSGLDELKISLDTASSDVYKEIRGHNYFDSIIEGIKQINTLREKKRRKNPSTEIYFVILKENLNEFIDLLSLARDLKINKVFFRLAQLEGLSQKRIKTLKENFDIEHLFRNLKKAERYASKLRLKTNLKTIVKNFATVKNMYLSNADRHNKRLKRSICLTPWFHLFISVKGDIAPCAPMFYNQGIKLGNIYDDEFKSIWNGKSMKDFRAMFRKKDNFRRLNICNDCTSFSLSELLAR